MGCSPASVCRSRGVRDDVFATIGSCNLRTRSLQNHTELNASVYDPSMVRALRCELFSEHLMTSTEDLDDRAALRLYAEIARANAQRRADRQGNVLATGASNRLDEGNGRRETI